MADEQGTTETVSAPPKKGRPPKEKALGLSDMPKPQQATEDEKDGMITKLKEALAPFAKMPYEPDAPKDKILLRFARGVAVVDITNGEIIKAKQALGQI